MNELCIFQPQGSPSKAKEIKKGSQRAFTYVFEDELRFQIF